ncbi:MAG TPA: sensor histidine kinase [Dehalococcoidia bacterium]
MKAEAKTAYTGEASTISLVLWSRISLTVRNLPQRFREPRFWQVQALVLLATAPHYAIEASGDQFATFEDWQLNSLAITLYILPLLYAALNYSWEGALLTGLWAAALTSPSLWLWDRSTSHYFTEIGQLVVVLPVGLLVAWRVDIEARHRRRAEKTSASLSLLNQTGEALSHTLEAEAQVPIVLRKLISYLSLESAWLYLEADRRSASRLLSERPDGSDRVQVRLPEELHRRVEASGATQVDQDSIAVPLSTDDGLLGSLGATVSTGTSPTDEQIEVLATVARQLCASIVNARLYRERQESLQSYVRHVTEAQEEERLRISRELHDETAQELVNLVRGLEQINDGSDDARVQVVNGLIESTRETIRSVRRVSRDLRPSALDDLGLTAAIEAIVEDADEKLPRGAKLRVTGKAQRVAAAVELALFRIAQESLRNVAKHARATSAAVELAFTPDAINLSISDDGVGFNASNVSDLARAGKLGLVGMKERCDLVGGSFDLQSSPGEGTRVLVTVASSQRDR